MDNHTHKVTIELVANDDTNEATVTVTTDYPGVYIRRVYDTQTGPVAAAAADAPQVIQAHMDLAQGQGVPVRIREYNGPSEDNLTSDQTGPQVETLENLVNEDPPPIIGRSTMDPPTDPPAA